jgi:hypothetical protein
LWRALTMTNTSDMNCAPSVTKYTLTEIIGKFTQNDAQVSMKSLERWVDVLEEDADTAEFVRQQLIAKHFDAFNSAGARSLCVGMK